MNYIQHSKILNPNKVLIDTWWNVNAIQLNVVSASGISFNRYMVECEFSKELGSIDRLHGFNRYMVECELNLQFKSGEEAALF